MKLIYIYHNYDKLFIQLMLKDLRIPVELVCTDSLRYKNYIGKIKEIPCIFPEGNYSKCFTDMKNEDEYKKWLNQL